MFVVLLQKGAQLVACVQVHKSGGFWVSKIKTSFQYHDFKGEGAKNIFGIENMIKI